MTNRTMSVRAIISALRTPLLLWAAVLPFVFSQSLLANVLLMINHYAPRKTTLNVFAFRPGYFLYLPNAVALVCYLLGAVLLLELKHAIRGRNRTAREDLLTAGIGAGLALSSLLFMRNMKPGGLQLLFNLLQVAVIWLFLVVNAELFTVQQSLKTRPWVSRLLNWTFPISDLFCYRLHQQRMSTSANWLKAAPLVSGLLLAGWALIFECRILFGALQAERLHVPVLRPVKGQTVPL